MRSWMQRCRRIAHRALESKRNERQSSDRLLRVLETARLALWSWDFERQAFEWSPLCIELFGEPGDTVATYELWLEHVHPDDWSRVRRSVRRAIQQREDLECEYRVVWPDGTVHWLLSVAKPIFDGGGRPLRLDGFIREITRSKEAESLAARRGQELEELHHALASRALEAETASRAKQALLGNLSHEFRTPLNHILGGAQLLREQPHCPDQARWIDLILQSGTHLLGIVEELLEITASAGVICPQQRAFAPRAMLHEVMASAAGRARQASITVVLNLDWALPDQVVGDPGLVARALLNYLRNAIKFSPPGSTVTLRVAADHVADDETRVRFEVDDQGPGVPAEAKRTLFEEVSADDSGLHRRVGGLGLGLATTRKIAVALGGEVGYERIPAGGSRFWLTVPMKQA